MVHVQVELLTYCNEKPHMSAQGLNDDYRAF